MSMGAGVYIYALMPMIPLQKRSSAHRCRRTALHRTVYSDTAFKSFGHDHSNAVPHEVRPSRAVDDRRTAHGGLAATCVSTQGNAPPCCEPPPPTRIGAVARQCAARWAMDSALSVSIGLREAASASTPKCRAPITTAHKARS